MYTEAQLVIAVLSGGLLIVFFSFIFSNVNKRKFKNELDQEKLNFSFLKRNIEDLEKENEYLVRSLYESNDRLRRSVKANNMDMGTMNVTISQTSIIYRMMEEILMKTYIADIIDIKGSKKLLRELHKYKHGDKAYQRSQFYKNCDLYCLSTVGDVIDMVKE